MFVSFDSGCLLRIAERSCKRANHVKDDVIVGIIFSVASIETFINDLLFIILLHKDDIECQKLFNNAIIAIEDFDVENHSLIKKLNIINKYCINNFIKDGDVIYQDALILIKIRNAIIHMRPDFVGFEDVKYSDCKVDKFLDVLRSKNLINYKNRSCNSWIDIIKTVKIAEWAYFTASSLIDKIIHNLPNSAVKYFVDMHADSMIKDGRPY